LIEALREKYRLFLVLIGLAVINLMSQHVRHRGLIGREMLIGTVIFATALFLYVYVRTVWDAKVTRQNCEAKEGGKKG